MHANAKYASVTSAVAVPIGFVPSIATLAVKSTMLKSSRTTGPAITVLPAHVCVLVLFLFYYYYYFFCLLSCFYVMYVYVCLWVCARTCVCAHPLDQWRSRKGL